MKKIAFPVLAMLATAVACTDSTAPNAHSALTVKQPTLAALTGHVPPPPVDAAIQITVSSTNPVTGVFTGTYFANGGVIQSAAAATELADDALAYAGTAWLRLDNTQAFGTTASANARFQTTDQKFSGHGTIVIEGVTIQIVEVTAFLAFPCTTAGQPCAEIHFKATRSDDPLNLEEHEGTATAFNREFCDVLEDGDFFLYCPSEEGGC